MILFAGGMNNMLCTVGSLERPNERYEINVFKIKIPSLNATINRSVLGCESKG